MKKALFFPALIVGIVFSAFFIFLVNQFATDLYTEAWFLFSPYPLDFRDMDILCYLLQAQNILPYSDRLHHCFFCVDNGRIRCFFL